MSTNVYKQNFVHIHNKVWYFFNVSDTPVSNFRLISVVGHVAFWIVLFSFPFTCLHSILLEWCQLPSLILFNQTSTTCTISQWTTILNHPNLHIIVYSGYKIDHVLLEPKNNYSLPLTEELYTSYSTANSVLINADARSLSSFNTSALESQRSRSVSELDAEIIKQWIQ